MKDTRPENLLAQLQQIKEWHEEYSSAEFEQGEAPQLGFNKNERLGSGGSGIVYSVVSHNDLAVKITYYGHGYLERVMVLQYGKTAAKIFKPAEKWIFNNKEKFEALDEIISELRSMQQHPGYEKLHHILHMSRLNDNKIHLFTERCAGSLCSLYTSKTGLFITRSDVWKTLVQDLVNAMNYIHHMEMAHLDIKPGNVLYKKVGEDYYTFLLTDYDFLTEASKDYVDKVSNGSLGYTLPTIAYNQKTSSDEYDIWLHGADMYALCITILCPIPEMHTVIFGHNYDIKNLQQKFDLVKSNLINKYEDIKEPILCAYKCIEAVIKQGMPSKTPFSYRNTVLQNMRELSIALDIRTGGTIFEEEELNLKLAAPLMENSI